MVEKQLVLAHRGLTLPRTVLRHLDKLSIFAHSHVSLEHQRLARRYVVRGIELAELRHETTEFCDFWC